MEILGATLLGTSVALLLFWAGTVRNPLSMLPKGPKTPPTYLRQASMVLSRIKRALVPEHQSAGWEEVFHSLAAQLKAGESVPNAVIAVSREGTSGPYENLAKVAKAYEAGVPLLQALESRAASSKEMLRLQSTLEIGQSTGSDLPALLCHSAESIAERRALRKAASAKLSESRITAVILSLLPWFIGYITWRRDPSSLYQMIMSPNGKLIMIGALALWFLGNVATILAIRSVTGDQGR